MHVIWVFSECCWKSNMPIRLCWPASSIKVYTCRDPSSNLISLLYIINFSVLIMLPTNLAALKGVSPDIWTVWRHFRTNCANSSRLYCGLSYTADLDDEFDLANDILLRRWYAEPVSR